MAKYLASPCPGLVPVGKQGVVLVEEIVFDVHCEIHIIDLTCIKRPRQVSGKGLIVPGLAHW